MTEMIERVARAMAENAGFHWDYCAQSQWKSDARAGIAAMREPTPEMFIAARTPSVVTTGEQWRAMIDSALSPADGTRP